MARTAKRALVPLALMGWIYFLSAQPDLNSGLGVIDLIGRKIIHAATYFTLTFAWWWALAPALGLRGRTLRVAIAIAFVYACTDEYHQHFVEGRHGSPVDVMIDSIGIAGAAWYVNRRQKRGAARRSEPARR